MLLVPSDPLNSKIPDDFFAPEAAAAKSLGLPVGLLDYEALDKGAYTSALNHVKDTGRAILRGWMMSVADYSLLRDELYQKDVELITSSLSYAAGHLLPNWYPHFQEITPQSIVLDKDLSNLQDALCDLEAKSAVIKDWTKSEKHLWNEAMFIPDTSDFNHAKKVCERFIALRNVSLSGTVVLRAFEKNLTGVELRSWWIDGEWVVTTAHPDTPAVTPLSTATSMLALSEFIAPYVAKLNVPFIAVDLAEKSDGSWIVIEAGDGQVSARPASSDPEFFINDIFYRYRPRRS